MIDTWNSYNPYLNTQPFLSEAADHLCDIADHLSYYTIDTTPGTVTHIPTDNNNEEN
jgi:hypothetical protein